MDMNLPLNDEMAAILQANVETGLYANEREVIYDALRRLEFNQLITEELKLTRLKGIIDKAIAESEAGLGVEYDFAKISAEIDQELST